MKKEKRNIATASLLTNVGQLPWLPKNPRQWTQDDVDRTSRSIAEDPDFLEDRPILVTPKGNGKWIVFAGNLRYTAAKSIALRELPCVVYYPDDQKDYDTIKRRAMKDNGSFGSWDFDYLANEWDDLPLADWGVPAWESDPTKMNLSTKGKEGNEEYDEFMDKFEPKLTTDDCYTPPAVYDAVLKFVGTIANLKGKKIERPFFPGGDFENHPYTKASVVVDNPPFSILAKILRFYSQRQIPFFLFAPALTLFSATDCDLTYIISDVNITYENGAVVRTGFITNMIPDLRIWCCPEMKDLVEEAQPEEDKTKQGFVYPDNIVTAATLGKITTRHIELKIRKASCEPIKTSDSAEEQGRSLYGGGFILSDKAAAERAAATRLNLSDRERAIIERLNKQDG